MNFGDSCEKSEVSGSLGSPYLSYDRVAVGNRIRSLGRDVELKFPCMEVKMVCGELCVVIKRYAECS